MATSGGPNIVKDNLVFGYDTGYPVISGSSDTYRFNKGEPTVNIRAGSGLDGSYSTSGRAIDNSGTLIAPDATIGWSSITSIGDQNAGYRIAKFPYNSLTSDVTYTFSLELYNPGPDSLEIFIDGNTGYTGITIPLGYSRWSYTITPNANKTQAIFFGTENKTNNVSYSPPRVIFFKNYQVEAKDHVTPFINGTRSISSSLLDLKRTTDIDLPNVSFDANAQLTFDGTDDRVENIGPVHSRLSSSATEAVFKAESIPSSGYVMIFGYKHVGGNYSQFTTAPITLKSDGAIFSSVITSNEVYRPVYSSAISTGRYYHVVLNKDTVNGTLELYVNGSLVSNTTFTASNYPIWQGIPQGTNYLEIGGLTTTSGWDKFLNGSVPIGKLYSRTITAQEVQQNYNAYKNRFNL